MSQMRLAAVKFVHFTQLRGYVWRWPHFSPAEMADRQTGELVIVPDFMDWLEGVRHVHGKPMIVTSGYRIRRRQLAISGREIGAHPDAMAVDVRVSGEDAERLERIAITQGVLGRGVAQSGPHHERYLHLDRWTKAPPGLRPRLWSY